MSHADHGILNVEQIVVPVKPNLVWRFQIAAMRCCFLERSWALGLPASLVQTCRICNALAPPRDSGVDTEDFPQRPGASGTRLEPVIMCSRSISSIVDER